MPDVFSDCRERKDEQVKDNGQIVTEKRSFFTCLDKALAAPYIKFCWHSHIVSAKTEKREGMFPHLKIDPGGF